MDISSVDSDLELTIRATYRVSWSGPLYNCTQCKKAYPLPARNLKGCHGSDRVVAMIGTEGVKICPANLYSETAVLLFKLWNEMKKGNLPFPGVITDQPAQIIDVFSLIDEIEMERIKSQKTETARGK